LASRCHTFATRVLRGTTKMVRMCAAAFCFGDMSRGGTRYLLQTLGGRKLDWNGGPCIRMSEVW